MYVCMYVCNVCQQIYVCMYVQYCIYMSADICLYVHVCMSANIYMYVCMCGTFDTDVGQLRHRATRVGIRAILNLQHRPIMYVCMFLFIYVIHIIAPKNCMYVYESG